MPQDLKGSYQIRDMVDNILEFGAMNTWEALKHDYPDVYNMLLLASLEMQAKELEQLRANSM
jgi:hypothetical protein